MIARDSMGVLHVERDGHLLKNGLGPNGVGSKETFKRQIGEMDIFYRKMYSI
jgi:hypothetical protein